MEFIGATSPLAYDGHTIIWKGWLNDQLACSFFNDAFKRVKIDSPEFEQLMATLWHEVKGHNVDDASHDNREEEKAFIKKYEQPFSTPSRKRKQAEHGKRHSTRPPSRTRDWRRQSFSQVSRSAVAAISRFRGPTRGRRGSNRPCRLQRNIEIAVEWLIPQRHHGTLCLVARRRHSAPRPPNTPRLLVFALFVVALLLGFVPPTLPAVLFSK